MNESFSRQSSRTFQALRWRPNTGCTGGGRKTTGRGGTLQLLRLMILRQPWQMKHQDPGHLIFTLWHPNLVLLSQCTEQHSTHRAPIYGQHWSLKDCAWVEEVLYWLRQRNQIPPGSPTPLPAQSWAIKKQRLRVRNSITAQIVPLPFAASTHSAPESAGGHQARS